MTIMHSEAPSPLPAQEIKPLQKNTSATSSLRHSRLCGAALLAFIIPHSSFLIAAPPPELTVLRQQYDKAYAERVTAVFEANKAALDAKFTTALDNAITTAKASGDLPAVLAIQEDKKAIEAKQDLPADTDSTPAALKTLRGIYREQLAKLTEQRTANTTALLTPYAAKLQALEATLTKADRVEEAKEVMDYRAGLKVDAPLEQAAMAATPAASPATTTTATAQKAPAVKGDDRKAAEWVLSVGGSVRLWDNANGLVVTKAEDLPKGSFSIRSIDMKNIDGSIKPFTDADMTVLGGLEKLTDVTFYKLPITPAVFDALCTCPELTQIGLQYNNLGDEIWTHLAGARKLSRLFASYDGPLLSGAGISQLGRAPLKEFDIGNNPAIADAALAEIASLTKLTNLSLESTLITDAGIKSIGALKDLTSLNVRGTDVTAAGLGALKERSLVALGFGRTMADLVAQAEAVAALFPKVEFLHLPRECNPTNEEWAAVAKAWPKLRRLYFNSHKFTDGACPGLTAFADLDLLDLKYCIITDAGLTSLSVCKKLRSIWMPDAKITEAALDTLAKMKSLKELKLPKPGNGLTAEGIAKFKKQRPDVKLN